LLEQGYTVRALARDPARARPLAALGVSLVEGDLDNSAALERLVAGVAAVVHCAGAVRGNSRDDFDRVNLAGTAHLLAAVEKQPQPPRLVLLSSVVAREPQLSWYAGSKRAGEQLLEGLATRDWIILRPPAVYGPGDREMLPIFQWMHRGIALVPGTPDARTSLIHVSDVVGAIERCLHSEQARGQILTLCDGRAGGYDWREMAAIAGELWRRDVRLVLPPPWLLNAVARANSAVARLTGRAPMLTPPKLRELRHRNWVVDNEAITRATGWEPRVELRQGLRDLNLAPDGSKNRSS